MVTIEKIFDEDELVPDCICGQLDPLPFTHADGCPVWEHAATEQRLLDIADDRRAAHSI